jgi:hypothetical protein
MFYLKKSINRLMQCSLSRSTSLGQNFVPLSMSFLTVDLSTINFTVTIKHIIHNCFSNDVALIEITVKVNIVIA